MRFELAKKRRCTDRFTESEGIVPNKKSLMKQSAMLVSLAFCVLLGAAWAQTETVLYSFCAEYNCNDGANPYAGVIFDQKGNLYGTTFYGGPYDECLSEHWGCGVVFKVTPEGRETVLYSFCPQGYPCIDGSNPSAGLVFDQKGNLYGTATSGGTHGEGVVFKVTPERKYTVLYNFCSRDNCPDGYGPTSGLVIDQKGNLYGTAGGGAYGAGVVFKLTPEGKETVYSFCAQGNPCIDGEFPYGGLVFDQEGNLYGTTLGGGSSDTECDNNEGCGVVFKLTPQGEETVLYSFCAQTDCTDGAEPYAGLTFDPEGNLYGTTYYGGAKGDGVVFKLAPTGEQSVLYSFCAQGYPCDDGQNPYAGVVLDQKGNIYGTTYYGGPNDECEGYQGCGVVFELSPTGNETVLYSFCAQNGICADGMDPYAGLVFDQKGNLYGTTVGGGTYRYGAVFKLTP
jgi:uncharacterized repeat protein (TIGR03803 family)